jgi:hypothetical protein
MTNYIIKKTRTKSPNPKYLNEERYYVGEIDLGALGMSVQWGFATDAQLLSLNSAQGLLQIFKRQDKAGNYKFETIVK